MEHTELILLELQKLNGRLDTMDRRLDAMEEKLNFLLESNMEMRSGVNTLLEWAENCGDAVQFPLPKVR